MKSSKDIPPRVGMQVRYRDDLRSKRICRVDSEGMDFDNGSYNRCTWEDPFVFFGKYYTIEWTPPSDDERRLFMEAARHCRDYGPTVVCWEYCRWRVVDMLLETTAGAAIAESLALDGADYDAMPDFEELER